MAKNIICALCALCIIFTSSKVLAGADYLKLHLFVGTEIEGTFFSSDKVDYWVGGASTTLGTFLNPEKTIFVDTGIKYLKYEFSNYEEIHVDDADYVGVFVGLGYSYHLKAINANLIIMAQAGLGYWWPEENVDFMADNGVTGDLGIMIALEFPLGKGWFTSVRWGFGHQSKAQQDDRGINYEVGDLEFKKPLKYGIIWPIKNFFRKLF